MKLSLVSANTDDAKRYTGERYYLSNGIIKNRDQQKKTILILI